MYRTNLIGFGVHAEVGGQAARVMQTLCGCYKTFWIIGVVDTKNVMVSVHSKYSYISSWFGIIKFKKILQYFMYNIYVGIC